MNSLNNFFGYLISFLWVILCLLFQFKGQDVRSDIFGVGAILLLCILGINKKEQT